MLVSLVLPYLHHQNVHHRRFVTLVAFLLFVRYILWRVDHSIMMTPMPTMEGFWIWICFINEIFIFIETGSFYLVLCKNSDRSKEADAYEAILRSMNPKDLPAIDVFLPTYNEGIDVLERSIVGTTYLDWPKDKLAIWVLDDGKRDWLRDFCKDKGVGYIRRADNVHAKAGNINHASMLTRGDFIVTLDADFVPYQNFIYRTLGFFYDPKVAIVQTPQHFFNKDFVQTNLHLHDATPDEQRLFFDVMMPARDAWDAAFWCGSCSLTRRTAMEACGGVPTTSITEDLLTTLTLLRQGYVTRYLNEKLSHGIAPEELSSLMTQRERWCRGTIQAFYDPMGPLGRGLTLAQRFLFFPIYWFFSPITRIMSHLVPIVFLWTGVPSVYLDHYTNLIDYHIPVILFNFAYELWIMPGHFTPLVNTASNTLGSIQVFPTVINSLFSPHARKTFAVTPKGRFNADDEKKTFYHPYSFWMTLLLLALTLGGTLKAMDYDFTDSASEAFYPIAASWAIFNCVILLIMLFLSIEQPKRRSEERFPVSYPTTLWITSDISAHITLLDMSLSGARGTIEHLESMNPDLLKHTIFNLVIHERLFPVRMIYSRDDEVRFQFIDLTREQRDHLIGFLYTGRFDNAPKHHSIAKLSYSLLKRAFGRHDAMYS